MIKQLLFRANVTVFSTVAVDEHVRMDDDDSCRREDKELDSVCCIFRWRGGLVIALVVMVGLDWIGLDWIGLLLVLRHCE